MTDKRAELLAEWADLCNKANQGYGIYRDGKHWTVDAVLDRLAQIRDEYVSISKEESNHV